MFGQMFAAFILRATGNNPITAQDFHKAELKKMGYFTANLWCAADVQSKFECEEDEALNILEDAMTCDGTMTTINEMIHFFIAEHKEEMELLG
jgi:hypothetical protein